jgi:hypothetical protein
MRYKTLLEKSNLQKGLISLLLTSLIVIVLLQIINKYTFTLVDTTYTSDNLNITYADLNGDNISERIEMHKYAEGKSSLIVKTNDQTIDQWNFEGDLVYPNKFFINDYDDDGNLEIFVFTISQDSLYMHGIDAMSAKIVFRDVPVCKLIPLNGNYNLTIELIDFFDSDKDGIKEILFAVMTGFAMRPRSVYSYNPASDRMTISPESCANLNYFIKTDLDRDSIPEYIPKSRSTGNCDSSATFSDMYSWLMVFEPDLTFKFPPQKTGSYPSTTSFIPFKWNSEESILAMHNYNGSNKESNYLAAFNIKGEILKKHSIADPVIVRGSIFITVPDHEPKPLILNERGTVYSIGKNLEVNKLMVLRNIQLQPPTYLDIDNDGKSEIIFLRQDRQGIIVFNNSFKHPAIIQYSGIEILPYYSTVNDHRFSNAISICLDKQNLIYEYHQTLVHRHWYIVILVVFFVIIATSRFVSKIREFRDMKKSAAQDQLSELQMRSIQNQLDPHFTFNILQSFGYLMNETDNEKATYLFDKYADLLKRTVLNSDKVLVTLEEELNFVESYILLERFRQQERFKHVIEISDEVEQQIHIPKMLIHIFVENAIKHGLRHRKPGGELVISAKRDDRFFKISIRDNGIGREAASKLARFSTGKGLGILEQILELYYLLHRKKIKYYITDLKVNQLATGTQVNIYIPQ